MIRLAAVAGSLRAVLTTLDVWVVPRQVTVSAADKAFTAEGALVAPRTDAQVSALVKSLIDACGRFA